MRLGTTRAQTLPPNTCRRTPEPCARQLGRPAALTCCAVRLASLAATSRDGVHFDTGWVYAQQELVPHGRCTSPPYCLSAEDVTEEIARSGATPLDELCCPIDHGITIPASSMTTVGGEHLLYYEGRATYHEMRYGREALMSIQQASWRKHRLAGVRHDPNDRRGQCGEVVTKPLDLGAQAAGPVYFTVNVGFSSERAAPTNGTSALLAEVLVGCGDAATSDGVARSGTKARRPQNTHSLARSVPIRVDSPAAVLRWRSGQQHFVTSTKQPRSRPLSLRFVLCGSAKLFGFSVRKGEDEAAPPDVETAVLAAQQSPLVRAPSPANEQKFSSADVTAAGSTASAPIPAPIRESAPMYFAAWARERKLRRRLALRAAEIRSHPVAYGRCSLRLPDLKNIVEDTDSGGQLQLGFNKCSWHRPRQCMYPMLVPTDKQPMIDGVAACKAHCASVCSTCTYASMSWSEYACICYDACNPSKLAVSQAIDDTHPRMVKNRPVIPVKGAGSDNVFDYVTFPIKDSAALSSEVAAQWQALGDKRFPRKLWRTTREWADDWGRYSEHIQEHLEGIFPYQMERPSAWSKLGDLFVEDGENSTATTLDWRTLRKLGLRKGFCKETNTDDTCEKSPYGHGGLKLSNLLASVPTPHHWRAALQACQRACAACSRCNYITISLQADDCSWYEDCNIDNLKERWDGFYSMHMPNAKKKAINRQARHGVKSPIARKAIAPATTPSEPTPDAARKAITPARTSPGAFNKFVQRLTPPWMEGRRLLSRPMDLSTRIDGGLKRRTGADAGAHGNIPSPRALKLKLHRYLSKVYPAAVEQFENASTDLLVSLYDGLTYLYAGDTAELRPLTKISSNFPSLPYLPSGAYYSTSGEHHGDVRVFSGGSFFRYLEPIEIRYRPTLAAGRPSLHSGFGARAGPTPAWTSPVAHVRYPLFPLGMHKVQGDSEAGGSVPIQRWGSRPTRATMYDGAEAHAELRSLDQVASLFRIAHGDLIEVEQWGGCACVRSNTP